MSFDRTSFKSLSTAIKFFRGCFLEFRAVVEGANLLATNGFQISEGIMADLAMMDRLELCLRKEPGQGNPGRIQDAGQHIQQKMIACLKNKQRGFLGSEHVVKSLTERVYTLGVVSLGAQLEEYKEAVGTREGLDSLRTRYITLIAEIERFEDDDERTVAMRIRQTITSRPPVARKHDRKAVKRMADRDQRARMKGTGDGTGRTGAQVK